MDNNTIVQEAIDAAEGGARLRISRLYGETLYIEITTRDNTSKRKQTIAYIATYVGQLYLYENSEYPEYLTVRDNATNQTMEFDFLDALIHSPDARADFEENYYE